MSHRAVELAIKKVHLQYKCAAQRQMLGENAAAVLPFFALADRIRSGGHWLREHPGILAALATVIVVARPRAALRWIRRGWIAWRTWRKVRSFAAGIAVK